MNKLTIAIVITTVTLGGMLYLSYSTSPNISLGSPITTILGTDKLSDSREVINTNFASLNNGKMGTATTTIPTLTDAIALDTIGTITTGTWNADVLTVTYGGTGVATMLDNQVLLGNGTSAIDKVSGLGDSGQFLTSNGAGTPPTWQTSAVDESLDYHWTGYHEFDDASIASSTITTLKGTTATLTNIISSGTQTLNGIAYTFPATDNASSTVLSTDGSGGLSWKEDDTSITTCSGTINVPSGNSNGTLYASCSFTASKIDLIVGGNVTKGWWTWVSGKNLIFTGSGVSTSNIDWDTCDDAKTILGIGTATSTGFSMTYTHSATWGGESATVNYIGTK